MPSALRHRGIEAWLENSNGQPIALSEDANIESNNISAWVNIKPRQSYTLRWRTSAGRSPRSALCEVFVKDGFYSTSDDLESSEHVSTSIMDETRRTTQSKTTKGWLNYPYSRFGCLRVRRRIQAYHDSTKTQPEILLLGSVRLEVRRVSGTIRNDQVYWGEGDDDGAICVFDPDGINVIDDAARGKPPYITFEFKFREDPKITRMNQRLAEENKDTKIGIRVTRKSSKNASGTLARPAIGRAEVTPGVTPSMEPSTSGSSQPLLNNKIGSNHLKAAQKLSKSGMLALRAEKGPSAIISALPRVPQARVSNANLVAPDSGLNVPSQSKVLNHPPSLPVTPGVTPSMEPSTSSQPLLNNKIGSNHLKAASLQLEDKILAALRAVAKGPSANTSALPRVQTVSNANLVAPDSGLPVNVASQSKVPSTTTKFKNILDPVVTPSIGPSANTSAPPRIPQARGEIVSNANLVAPDSGLNVASQSKVLDHPPSLPPTTTENIFHSTEIILSTELAIPASQPPPEAIDRTITTNPDIQTGHSDSELDGRPPTTTELEHENIIHTEMILGTESATGMPTSEPSSAPMDITTTVNPGMQIEPLDGELDGRRLGVLPSDGVPTGFFHSHNSPGRETDSHVEIPLTVCEPEMAAQINEVQQQSTGEGGDRALTIPTTSSEIVNVAPDIGLNMVSNLDLGGREQFRPNNSAEVVLEKSPDIVELLSPSSKGKRKMIDRGDDSIAHVPAGDGGFKRNRMTIVEEDYSDIEYIGSWRPGKTRKKIKPTAVKMENVPIKLENPLAVSDPDPLPTLTATVKPERFEIKLEDNQLDRKRSIDEMMGNYDALERKKEELKQKLVVKMEVQQREIEELLRRLDD